MEGHGDFAPSIEFFRCRQKQESPSRKPSKPKYLRREERGGKESTSLPFAGRWVLVAQADVGHCLWPRRQPSVKPIAVPAARAELGCQARAGPRHPESALPPLHHCKVAQIN